MSGDTITSFAETSTYIKNVNNYSHSYFIRARGDLIYTKPFLSILTLIVSTAIISWKCPYDRNIIYNYMQVINPRKCTSPSYFVAYHASFSSFTLRFAHVILFYSYILIYTFSLIDRLTFCIYNYIRTQI